MTAESKERAIWRGALRVGAVELAVAVMPAQRRGGLELRLLHGECSTPLTSKRWCPFHDREVEEDEVVRGWQVEEGVFVVVDEQDSPAPVTSQVLELESFVAVREVDPQLYFETPYWLRPASDPAGRRVYATLARALRAERKLGLGSMVFSRRERVCAVSAPPAPLSSPRLMLHTLRLTEDLLPGDPYGRAAGQGRVNREELALTRELVCALTEDFAGTSLAADGLRGRLEAKRDRAEVVRPKPLPAGAGVPDLEAALRASIDELAREGRKAA